MDPIFLVWLISALIFGLVCAGIAPTKNRSGIAFFFAGFVLSLVGLIICITAPMAPPKGMRAHKCPKCNAETNVDEDSQTVECWQCHLVSPNT